MSMHELLTPLQMSRADRLTIETVCPGIELMENAGKSVLGSLQARFPEANSVLVICGIGNNGGDGFVLARLLADEGKTVKVFVCGDITSIRGDAELALARLDKNMLLADLAGLEKYDVVVDALLGAGLDRDVTGKIAEAIDAINQCDRPVISVDLPSGIDGRTGRVRGCAIKADCTVTFFRLKPGHLLYPGRHYCGATDLAQIGIPKSVLATIGSAGLRNSKDWWQSSYPFPKRDGHKYDRGHVLALSGPAHSTGAARLVAGAALRSGAGLVTLASPTEALPINACHLTSVMLKPADSPEDVQQILQDKRFNCVVLGPGMEPDGDTRAMVLTILKSECTVVLDAGALTAFDGNGTQLFNAIKKTKGNVFLTPHQGEFARLFPATDRSASKLEQAKTAAKTSGATIVLKGADTVVATTDDKASVCDNAPPWLATAGSGDVLAGIVAGLAAQAMPPFEAASAAVWLHAEAANILGAGMISSDLDEGLRVAINTLMQAQNPD